jgi:hypothetical protein
VYDGDGVAPARPDGAFLINLNSGPAMTTSVSFDPATEPAHWFVVDRAIAHRHGIAVVGPVAADVIAAVPRPMVLDALAASIAWHGGGDRHGVASVLNGCRALRYVDDDALVSKADAAAWAIDTGIAPDLVAAAVDGRRSRHPAPPALSRAAVAAFLADVAATVDAAR